MTEDELRRVHETYRAAVRAHDAALRHPDLGRRTASGFAAQGLLRHAADALREAERRWESTRLGYLAQQAEHGAGQLPLD
jgi:hypothetical protein